MEKKINNPLLLVDIAYSAIKEDVLNKYLVPGKKIIIRELSERYDISATPIKQALNRFITEGLIESIPRRGVYVKKYTFNDLKEMNQTRMMIELYAVPSIINKFKTDSQYAKNLEKTIEEFEMLFNNVKADDDIIELSKADFKFHLFLISSLDNKIVNELYNRMVTQTIVLFYIYGTRRIERLKESLEEHKLILNSIKREKEEEIKDAIYKHFIYTEQEWKQTLK